MILLLSNFSSLWDSVLEGISFESVWELGKNHRTFELVSFSSEENFFQFQLLLLYWPTTLPKRSAFCLFEALFSLHCCNSLSLSLTSIACSSCSCTGFVPIHLSFGLCGAALSLSFTLKVICGFLILLSIFFFWRGNLKTTLPLLSPFT